MKRPIFVFAGVLGFVLWGGASALEARQGKVVTRNGRTLTGDVEEKDGNVVVNIRGIRTTLPKADVASIEYDVDVEKEFARRKAALGGADAAGRVELARWAFDQGKYELARDVLDEALKIDPNSLEAATMMATVRNQMRFEREASTQRAAPRPGTGAEASAGDGVAEAPPGAATRPAATRAGNLPPAPRRPVLTAEDVNVIRQHELRDGDNVRIQFANDVKKRFAEQQNMTVQQFNALPPLRQAFDIIEQGDESMRRDVRIQTDPQAILDYRRLVQPMVLANCATSGCHGGSGTVGGLWLINPADNDAATYTNFYLLQQYRKPRDGGTGPFGAGDLRMIDRTHPDDSLLLNHTLPSAIATFDHPPVQNFRPVYRNRQDAGYQRLAEWLGRTLRPVEPDYRINFDPGVGPAGGGAAATQPAATQPATDAAATAPAR